MALQLMPTQAPNSFELFKITFDHRVQAVLIDMKTWLLLS